MNTRHFYIVLTILVAVPAIAFAGWFGDERPPVNGKPLSEIIKVEFEDSVYEIEALDAQDNEIELKVDPVSGKVSTK